MKDDLMLLAQKLFSKLKANGIFKVREITSAQQVEEAKIRERERGIEENEETHFSLG